MLVEKLTTDKQNMMSVIIVIHYFQILLKVAIRFK